MHAVGESSPFRKPTTLSLCNIQDLTGNTVDLWCESHLDLWQTWLTLTPKLVRAKPSERAAERGAVSENTSHPCHVPP